MKFRKLASALLISLLLASAAVPAVSALTPHGTGILMRKWLINDPNYQFSEAYKTSVWYENFTALELTQNDRNNILRIAISQLGYHEGNSPEDFDGMNTEGSENYIEYGRLLVPNWNDNSYDWCACFVNWCLNQARFDKASSEISCRNWVSELTAMNMYQKSKAHGGSYTPRPADFIFFNREGKSSPATHIGFVLYTTETHVYTIEGNASDKDAPVQANTGKNNVTIRSYPLNDSRVIGYGTPPYREGNEPTVDYSYAGGMPVGKYVVGSYDATLLSAPTEGDPLCAIPVGSTVTLLGVEENMACVRYGDTTGYMTADILWLMMEEITLTFDANGGVNPPASETIYMGAAYILPHAIPSLEGDTFLGWSLTPYDAVPDFRAGDTVSLGSDATLYAVWEKRSLKLAAAAFGEGKAPLFTRPEATQNGAALLSDVLTNTSLFSNENAVVTTVTDDTLGTVLSMTVGQGEAEATVTLDYAALAESLLLSPARGEAVRFAVLKVKSEMTNTAAWWISFNGMEAKPASLAAPSGDWQYAVVDLTQGGFEGDLQTVEFGLKTADTSLSFLLSEIFFVSTQEQVDALISGAYIFPTQEKLSSETTTEEPTTEAPVPPSETTASTDTSADPTDTSIPSDSTEDGSTDESSTEPISGGCASTLALTSLVSATVASAAFVMIRKRKN